MKTQMTIKFVNYPVDDADQPITQNPDYLRVQGTVNRNGLVINVSTLVYREPGAFETPEHEAGYRGLFGALERLAAFQEASRDPDGSMEKGSVAKVSRFMLTADDAAVGQPGTHLKDGVETLDKYTPLVLLGEIGLEAAPAPKAAVSKAVLDAVARM